MLSSKLLPGSAFVRQICVGMEKNSTIMKWLFWFQRLLKFEPILEMVLIRAPLKFINGDTGQRTTGIDCSTRSEDDE